MNGAKLKAESLNLWLGKKHVLKDVNISFPSKKVTALIGPSGCSKSTLLRCFNPMHDLADDVKIEGLITIDGLDIYDKKNSVTEMRKRIGMVFQKANPLPKSIYDNLASALSLHNNPQRPDN